MKSTKLTGKLLVACIALISVAALLKASYYKPNFFPIGLTGLNYTGYDTTGQGNPCPYGNVDIDPRWDWTEGTNNEQALIEALGVNCLGCQDAYRRYLLDFNPSSGHSQNNYLYKVCPYAPDSNPVYIITASYYTTPRVHLAPHDTVVGPEEGGPDTIFLRGCNGPYKDTIVLEDESDTFLLDITDVDECEYAYYYDQGSGKYLPVLMSFSTTNWPVSSLFRSPYRNYIKDEFTSAVGSMQFSLRIYPDNYGCGEYNRHGRNPYDGDNWSSFGGDSVWCAMADEAVWNFDSFFTKHEDLSKYIWGWNLITEDPAVSRGDKINNRDWRGCWAAVDRIFRGSNSTGFNVVYEDRDSTNKSTCHGTYECETHEGIRGVEAKTLGGTNRMIIAKQGTSGLDRGGYNIFNALPDLDAFVTYSHQWCRPYWNYGEQVMFDWFLYGDPATPLAKGGRHNIALYFQQNKKPSGQRGRWLETIDLAWYTTGASWGASRRPCPPEIRCATYLSLSRGAKGIFFHGWTFESNPGVYPNTAIPCASLDLDEHVGIRDHNGYPFGEAGSYNLKLNSSAPQAPYWSGRTDSTYYYLKTHLIPEIKAISDVLMQLDWVNAYSLKSTDPEWASPCPHVYIKSITTTDSGYIDLGFFDDPADAASEYFMIVNRDGIADMTDCIIEIVMSGWDVDKIKLTDMSDTNSIKILVREPKGEFSFQEVFEPGEGKLYRVRNYDGTALPEVRR